MKKIHYIFGCCLSLFMASSCNTDGFIDEVEKARTPESLPWMATTSLDVKGVEDMENFIWKINLVNSEEYWGLTDVEYEVQINSLLPKSQFSKIEFYITFQEQEGYNYSAPFDYEGKLIQTVNNWDEEGKFLLTINADEAYALFLSDLEYDRSEKLAREGDQFEIHWVIYGTDGEMLDSRDQAGAENRFGFGVQMLEFEAGGWGGTFETEWIGGSDNALRWGGFSIGQKGSVTITKNEDGTYSIDNLMFGYYHGTAGTIFYNFDTGLLSVEGGRGEKWTVVSVDGDSIDIDIEYEFSATYDVYLSIRLIRKDGTDWQANTHTE